MKNGNLVVFSALIISLILLTGSKCSNTSKQNEEISIEIGEIITLFEIPYLNDHTIIYNPKDSKWHLFGIIKPQTCFIHLTADSLHQQGWLREEDFSEGGAEIWAPHIVYHDTLFHMFYTRIGEPREIHHITSEDLYNWSKSTAPILALSNKLNENLKNKDPMVFRDEERNQWIMYYSMMKDATHWVVGYSISSDLVTWSETRICFDENSESPGVESPFVVKYKEYYYLFLSARPWPVGGEDIFRSESPFNWNATSLVKRIDPWHAAEVIRDLKGNWYLTLSSGMQAQDLRMAPLFWE
jgi:hypothetical protein